MTRAEAREKARALVAQMTVEERAGQLLYTAPAIERLGIPAYNWSRTVAARTLAM